MRAPQGRVVVKIGNRVFDSLERAQNLCAGLGRVNRAVCPFQSAYAGVGVEADDKEISQICACARSRTWPGCRISEAAVREDDRLAGKATAVHLGEELALD